MRRIEFVSTLQLSPGPWLEGISVTAASRPTVLSTGPGHHTSYTGSTLTFIPLEGRLIRLIYMHIWKLGNTDLCEWRKWKIFIYFIHDYENIADIGPFQLQVLVVLIIWYYRLQVIRNRELLSDVRIVKAPRRHKLSDISGASETCCNEWS